MFQLNVVRLLRAEDPQMGGDKPCVVLCVAFEHKISLVNEEDLLFELALEVAETGLSGDELIINAGASLLESLFNNLGEEAEIICKSCEVVLCLQSVCSFRLEFLWQIVNGRISRYVNDGTLTKAWSSV